MNCLSICLSVCLSVGISHKSSVQISQNFFRTCCLWPWLCPPLSDDTLCNSGLWMTPCFSGVTRLQWARVQVFQKGPPLPQKTFKKQRRANFGPPTALGPRALHALHALLLRHCHVCTIQFVVVATNHSTLR